MDSFLIHVSGHFECILVPLVKCTNKIYLYSGARDTINALVAILLISRSPSLLPLWFETLNSSWRIPRKSGSGLTTSLWCSGDGLAMFAAEVMYDRDELMQIIGDFRVYCLMRWMILCLIIFAMTTSHYQSREIRTYTANFLLNEIHRNSHPS